MNKCFCDMCGKEVKSRKSLRWQYVRLFFEDDKDVYLDLCLDCYEKLKILLKNNINKKNIAYIRRI